MPKRLLSRIYYGLPAAFSGLGYAFPCRNVMIEIVYSCNLNCVMCPYAAEMRHEQPRGSDFKPLGKDELIALMRELPKGRNINFTGGEPFLKEGILEIIEEAAKRHKVSIATNGTLFNDSLAEKLVRWKVRLVGFSLDGPREVHNEIRRDQEAYDKLMDAIDMVNRWKKELNSACPRLNLNAVILKKNFDKLEGNIDLAKKKGVSSCSFQICDPSWDRSAWRLSDKIAADKKTIKEVEPIDRGKLKEALEKLLKKAKEENVSAEFMPCLSLGEVVDYYDNKFDLGKWHCLNPWSTVRISPYGDVFPCLNFKIGNIREEKLSKLWNNTKYRRFRRELGKAVLFDSCAGCCKMERKRVLGARCQVKSAGDRF